MDAILELGLVNAVVVAALAVVVAFVTWLCRRPALAHALWLLVLVKLITPPLLSVEVPWPQPMATELEPAVAAGACANPPGPLAVAQPEEEQLPDAADAAGDAEVLPPLAAEGPGAAPLPEAAPSSGSIPWQTAVAALWLGGACCWWCLAAWRLGRFRWLLRGARRASPEVQARAEALAARLGLFRCPSVRLVAAPLPPLLWSLLGPPCVFLPERLWAELSDAQQDTLLAHELAHLQRHDHWVRWLELLALGLYWWHPAAWWARRALHEAEELLCDARVLRTLPGAADAYAQALIQTVAFLSGPRLALPGAASGMGQVRPLKARVVMIMRGTNADRLPRAGAWALAGLGLALVLLRPAWAPSPASAAPPDQPAAAPAPEATGEAQAKAVKPSYWEPVRVRVGQRISAGEGQIGAGPGPGGAPASARAANSRPIEADQQVELLRAQLAAKEAELQEARALMKLASLRLKRSEQLHRTGALPQEELDQATADLEVQQARILGKEAQVREAQLRLSMSARKSAQPRQTGQRFGGAMAPGAPGGFAPKPELRAPGQADYAPGPNMPVPAGAFPGGAPLVRPPAVSGDRNSLPGGMNPMRAGMGYSNEPQHTEKRLQQLEQKLDVLMKELQALRSQMSQGQNRGGGRPAADPTFRRQTTTPEAVPDTTRPEVPSRP